MRRALPGDVTAAACALLALPEDQRKAAIAQMLARADMAEAYRRRSGKLHPQWGDGSLMSVAMAQSLRREPFWDDPEYASCMLLVYRAFLDRAAPAG